MGRAERGRPERNTVAALARYLVDADDRSAVGGVNANSDLRGRAQRVCIVKVPRSAVEPSGAPEDPHNGVCEPLPLYAFAEAKPEPDGA